MKMTREMGKGGKKPGALAGVTQRPGAMGKMKPMLKDQPIGAPPVAGGPTTARGPKPGGLGIRGAMKPRPGKYRS